MIRHIQSPLPQKQKVSILIPAYKSALFIEECLDSIESQTSFTNNNEFEVLVGIDACEQTYRKLIDIRHKYRNLRTVMLKKNSGTYIVLNTLLGLIRSENIIIFGSDDVMRSNLVDELLYASTEADLVVMGYNAFISETRDARRVLEYAHGAIYFNNKVIDIAGGYRPWRCAADTELLQRISKRVKIGRVNKVLFYRRLHDNSLTKRTDTGRRSDLRKEYTRLIREYQDNEDIHIDRVTCEFIEV